MQKWLSRRALVAGLAATPILPVDATEQPDAELIALGGQFDELTALLDRTGWADEGVVAQFAAVEKAILDRQAITVTGLSVKARAGLLGLVRRP